MFYKKLLNSYRLNPDKEFLKIANVSNVQSYSTKKILDDVAIILAGFKKLKCNGKDLKFIISKSTSYELITDFIACVLSGATFIVLTPDQILDQDFEYLLKKGFIDIEVAKKLNKEIIHVSFTQIPPFKKEFKLGFFTSGSSGHPKLIFFIEKDIVRKISVLSKIFSDTPILSCLPLGHVYGSVFVILYSLYFLRKTYLVNKFDIKLLNLILLNELERFLFAASPAQIHLLNLYPEKMLNFLDKIKVTTTAGAFLDINTYLLFKRRFGGSLCQLYGLTEMLGSVAIKQNLKPADFINTTSSPIGQPLSKVKITIVKNKTICASETVGELLIENKLLSGPIKQRNFKTKDYGFYKIIDGKRQYFFSHRHIDRIKKNDTLLDLNSLNRQMWSFDLKHFSKSIFLNVTLIKPGPQLALVILLPCLKRIPRHLIETTVEKYLKKTMRPDYIFVFLNFDFVSKQKIGRKKIKDYIENEFSVRKDKLLYVNYTDFRRKINDRQT